MHCFPMQSNEVSLCLLSTESVAGQYRYNNMFPAIASFMSGWTRPLFAVASLKCSISCSIFHKHAHSAALHNSWLLHCAHIHTLVLACTRSLYEHSAQAHFAGTGGALPCSHVPPGPPQSITHSSPVYLWPNKEGRYNALLSARPHLAVDGTGKDELCMFLREDSRAHSVWCSGIAALMKIVDCFLAHFITDESREVRGGWALYEEAGLPWSHTETVMNCNTSSLLHSLKAVNPLIARKHGALCVVTIYTCSGQFND